MPKAGDAYIEIHGDFGPLNAQLKGSGFNRSLGGIQTSATRSFRTVGVEAEKAGRVAGPALRRTGAEAERAGQKAEGARSHVSGFGRTAERTGGLLGSPTKRLIAFGAGFASASAAIAGARNAVETTEELSKGTLALHRNLGLTIDDASRWAAVAKARNIDTSDLSTSFTNLSKNVEKALSPKPVEASVKAFDALGVSTEDLKRGQSDFGFLTGKVAEGLGKMEGGTQRAAIAQQLLGRSSQNTLPIFTQGRKAMEEQLKLADRYGVTLDGKTIKSVKDLITVQKELEFAQLGLQVQFTRTFGPVLTKAFAGASKFINDTRKIFNRDDLTGEEKWNKFGDMVSQKIEEAVPKIANAAGRIAPKVALGFIRGFFHADAWGQLAAGTFLISKLAGWETVFKAAGRRSGITFGRAMAIGAIAGLGLFIVEWELKHKQAIHRVGREVGEAFINGMIDVVNAGIEKLNGPLGALSKLPGVPDIEIPKIGHVDLRDWDEHVNAAHRLRDAYKSIPKKVDTLIKGETEGTVRKVDSLSRKLESVGRKKTVAKILAESDSAKEAIRRLQRQLDHLPPQKKIKIILEEQRRRGAPAGPLGPNALDRLIPPRPRQRGGMIPGTGDGDKVHVLAEPGEGFINKRAVRALGGPAAIDRINRTLPRFQLGGVVTRDSRMIERTLREKLGPERFEKLSVEKIIEKAGASNVERFVERLGPERFSARVERQGPERISREIKREKTTSLEKIVPRATKLEDEQKRKKGTGDARTTRGATATSTGAYTGPFGSGEGFVPVTQYAKSLGLRASSGRTNHPRLTTTGNVSDHSWGGAVDFSNGVLTPAEDKFAAFWKAHPKVLGQVIWRNKVQAGHNKGSTVEDHTDHVHLGLLRRYAFDSGAMEQVIGGKPAGDFNKPRINRSPRRLGLNQIVTLAKRVGFPDPALAAAVAYAESKGVVGATGVQDPNDHGLWQINTHWHPSYDPKKLESDIFYNARAALAISKRGRDWTPWVTYNHGDYKNHLGGKATPLPRIGGQGASAPSYADWLASRIELAQYVTPGYGKDELRWINKAISYWTGVLRRNRGGGGNPQRLQDAISNLTTLKDDRREAIRKGKGKKGTAQFRLPDSKFELTELGPQIGKGGAIFSVQNLQGVLDSIEHDAAFAGLTEYKDREQNLIPPTWDDDLVAANRLSDLWNYLLGLTTGKQTLPGVGSFVPAEGEQPIDRLGRPTTPAKAKWWRHKDGSVSGAPRTVEKPGVPIPIMGTPKQQTFAAQQLKAAREAVAGIQEEAKAETGTAAETISPALDLEAFRQAFGELIKQASNIKPLQSFGDGGIIQGPQGKAVIIEGHGGEAIINEQGNLVVKIDPAKLQQPGEQVIKQIHLENHFKETPEDPHGWSRVMFRQAQVA